MDNMTESRYKSEIEESVRRLSRQLIDRLCDIPEDSGNYRRAQEYVGHSLQHHSFLSPLHVDVAACYSNVVEKLTVNSQVWKAQRLDALYNKFLKRKLVNPKGVVDLNVRLLDLLLKLSVAPLESEYIPPKVFEQASEVERVPGEEIGKEIAYSESDEGSELSEESENGSIVEDDKLLSPIVPKSAQAHANSIKEVNASQHVSKNLEHERVRELLGTQVILGALPTNPLEQIMSMPLIEETKKLPQDEFIPKRTERKPYPRRQDMMESKLRKVNALLGCRTFKKIQDDVLTMSLNSDYLKQEPAVVGKPLSPYAVVEESYLVSSVLVMLMGCDTNLFVWNARERTYSMENTGIRLLNVSNGCLLEVLREIMNFASSLNYVRQEISNSSQLDSQVVQGFTSAIDSEFSAVESEIIRIHEVFLYQRGLVHCSQLVVDGEHAIWHPVTLQYLLDWIRRESVELSEYRKLLSLLQEQETAAISTRVCALLDNLFELVMKSSMHGASRVFGDNGRLWRVLISSLEPYVRILAQWVTKGQLTEDKHGEFFIKHNTALKNESDTFKEWTSMFALQLDGNRVALPGVLAAEAEHIVRFGKTVKVLEFWKRRNLFSGVELQQSDLAKEIVGRLKAKTAEDKRSEVRFSRERTSACLELAREKGAGQFVETSPDVSYYANAEFSPAIVKASALAYSSSNFGRPKAQREVNAFAEEVNSAPYQFAENCLAGLMTLQLTPTTDASIEDIEIAHPEHFASPSKTEGREISPPARAADGIYRTSVEKYDCEALMQYYAGVERAKTAGLAPLARNVVDDAILSPLAESFKATGESFTKYVNGDWRLKMHLEEWQSIYLMLNGHAIQTFLVFLLERIASDSPLDLFENLHEWNNSLRECIGVKKDIANNFSFIDKAKAGKGKAYKGAVKNRQTNILLTERIFLKYTSEFPLNIVMCEEAEEKYNRIFQWLLKIKRAGNALQNLKEWRQLSADLPSLSYNRLVHQFQLFEREVGHFTKVLESFVYTRAVVPHATAVVAEMLQAKDFDSLVSHHLKRLQKIIDISLCDVLFVRDV